MSEMVNRIAVAIGVAADDRAAGEGCDDVGVLDADLCIDLAGRLILELNRDGYVIVPREPTEAMTALFADVGETRWKAAAIWRAMVDAALAEKKA